MGWSWQLPPLMGPASPSEAARKLWVRQHHQELLGLVASNLGKARSRAVQLCSCGGIGWEVFAWIERLGGSGGWDKKLVHDFKRAEHTAGASVARELEPLSPLSPSGLSTLQVPVWRVSWSTTGSLLAVSDANNSVTLWKESVDGLWQQIPHSA
ncbi:WD_REPEATS_REGION domain-containing protein [Haematococcus lacustris]|uniref:WD_REPEATS_REGION domain-containing protein n=1 Tax=Haematococcus lacustris TaxID=44745 RepID=A0A699ZYM6_HAELA|nr:WD_REPEATS_REGION domain-containing protein [Haematococcus lacustris]